MAELGYLDEEHYFQDNSDHDLMARAYLLKGYICGYVPIDFSSPLKHGTTRKSIDPKNRAKLDELRSAMGGGAHIETHRTAWKNVQPKQYKLH